jgi:anti-anti-sigma factor
MTTTLHSALQGSTLGREPPLWISVSRGRRLAVVVAGGELDIATAPLLAEVVDELAAVRRFRRVVIDLSAVTFVDLHGLRVLDRLTARAAGHAAPVEVVPSASLQRLRRMLVGPGPFSLVDRPVA